VSVFLFDLDDTLYSRTLGVVARIDRRINEYMVSRVGIDAAEVDALRRRFWAENGTTLAGLMLRHAVDPDDYLDFIHAIELSDLLLPDAELGAVLEALPGRRLVFTNASRAHAARVLARLGIAPAFAAVVSLEDLGYVGKPAPQAYALALARAGADAASATLVEDNRANLAPAKRLGMRTVWVTDAAAARDGVVDHVIPRVHAIAELV
jgi:putative hydrolase of the HAD superfamily